MLASQKLTHLVALVMAAAVTMCILAVGFSGKLKAAAQDTGISMEYETALFQTDSVLDINIIMDEDQWADMLGSAIQETFYECTVEIGGKTFYRVGIRPKGNTSLSAIVSDPDSDRYSFKLKFDKFVKGQTCFGLDELILNNNYADATNMKEALIYDLYGYLGADASLYNYAKISVNGSYWGVYLALESVGSSFLLRNYGTQSGSLYKPETMDGGGGGGFGGSTGGADLNYTDDSLTSYSTIWDNAVTKVTEADEKRVVEALKNISQGTALESYMDIDNLLRYMAVHVFSVNEDSLTGTMAHNYYLYESGGKLNLIPWDYNLSFGGMGQGTGASGVINSPIDNAFTGTTFFDTLMENETYNETYYAYLRQIARDYVEGGAFDAFYNRVRSQLDSLVETDPTAFYSAEEYQKAADTLYQVVKRRGQSVLGQAEGTIPSTRQAQSGSTALVDASGITISDMGTMNMGGKGQGGRDDDFRQNMQPPENGGNLQKPDGAGNGGDFQPPDAVGEMGSDGNFQPPALPEGMENMQPPADGGTMQLPNDAEGMNAPQQPQGAMDANPAEAAADEAAAAQQQGQRPGGRGFQGEGSSPGGQSEASTAPRTNLLWYAISLAVLAGAMLLAILFRRKIR